MIYNSDDFSDFTNISDVKFLEKNKNKVFQLFANYENDFNHMKGIIYEA